MLLIEVRTVGFSLIFFFYILLISLPAQLIQCLHWESKVECAAYVVWICGILYIDKLQSGESAGVFLFFMLMFHLHIYSILALSTAHTYDTLFVSAMCCLFLWSCLMVNIIYVRSHISLGGNLTFIAFYPVLFWWMELIWIHPFFSCKCSIELDQISTFYFFAPFSFFPIYSWVVISHSN